MVTLQKNLNALIRGELAAQGKTQTALATALGFSNRTQVADRLSSNIDWKTTELEITAKFLNFANLYELFALAEERERRIERN